MKTFKIWGGIIKNYWDKKIGGGSQIRCIVKARTLVEAVELLKITDLASTTLYTLNLYWSETSNPMELGLTYEDRPQVWVIRIDRGACLRILYGEGNFQNTEFV